MPKNAVLSPVLFNVLMQDLVRIIEIEYLAFAEDLAVFYSDKDPQVVVDKLKLAMMERITWCNRWG